MKLRLTANRKLKTDKSAKFLVIRQSENPVHLAAREYLKCLRNSVPKRIQAEVESTSWRIDLRKVDGSSDNLIKDFVGGEGARGMKRIHRARETQKQMISRPQCSLY